MWNLFQMEVPVKEQRKFEEVGQFNLETSYRNEPGTQMMVMAKEKSVEGRYWIIEHYQDEVAYQVHRSSPQFGRFVAEGAILVTKRLMFSLEYLEGVHALKDGIWKKEDSQSLWVSSFSIEDNRSFSDVCHFYKVHASKTDCWWIFKDKKDAKMMYILEWQHSILKEMQKEMALTMLEHQELMVLVGMNH